LEADAVDILTRAFGLAPLMVSKATPFALRLDSPVQEAFESSLT
jgi:hypothetical protein